MMSSAPSAISLGGAAVPSFDAAPTAPLFYAHYYAYDGAGPSSATPWEQAASREPDRVHECIRRSNEVREMHQDSDDPIIQLHRRTYGTFQLPDGTLYEGVRRRGALYCRTGRWLEVVDNGTALAEKAAGLRERAATIRGTKNQTSKFTVLEFLSVSFGLISIRGVESDRYLCMDKRGLLYSAPPSNYSSECIFIEEMQENYYNLYSSCIYGTLKAPWHVAMRRTGRVRKGLSSPSSGSRKRRKSTQFLVLHYDVSQDPRKKALLPEQAAQQEARKAHEEGWSIDLSVLLASSLKNGPPVHHDPISLEPLVSTTAPAKAYIQHYSAAIRRRERRKFRRKQRLMKEQMQREQRKKELNDLRMKEPLERERKLIEYQKMQEQEHFNVEKEEAEKVERLVRKYGPSALRPRPRASSAGRPPSRSSPAPSPRPIVHPHAQGSQQEYAPQRDSAPLTTPPPDFYHNGAYHYRHRYPVPRP